MLDGITVLSEQTVTESCFWHYLMYFIGLGFVFSLIFGVIVAINEGDKSVGFGVGCLTWLIVIGIGGSICLPIDRSYKQEHTYTEYKVTIDSTVNFLDFEERYIITDKEGQIYTIIDRNEITDQS